MGHVYKAHDPKLRRDVAIKVLGETRAWDGELVERFEHEALALASLSHPNVVTVFELGREAGSRFVVTELLHGSTLRERLESGPLPHRQALELALQTARGLGAAHQRGSFTATSSPRTCSSPIPAS